MDDDKSRSDFLKRELEGSAPQYDPAGGMRTAKEAGRDIANLTTPGAIADAAGYLGGPSALENWKRGNKVDAALQVAGTIPVFGPLAKLGAGAHLAMSMIPKGRVVEDALKTAESATKAAREPYTHVASPALTGRASLQTPDLMAAVHGISHPSVVKKLADLGGHPNPSIAIAKPYLSPRLGGFGGIHFIAKPDVVNPSKTPVFAGDVFSPRFPAISNGKLFRADLDKEVPATLENISEEMNNYPIRGGEQYDPSSFRSIRGYGTLNSVHSQLAPQFQDFLELKSNRHRLTDSSEMFGKFIKQSEQYDDLAKLLHEHRSPEIVEFNNYPYEYHTSTNVTSPYFADALTENAIHEFYPNAPKDLIEEAKNLRQSIIDTPVTYFEAKPTRPIRPNEWAGAIIAGKHDNPQLREAAQNIEKMGLNPIFYDTDYLSPGEAVLKHFKEHTFAKGGSIKPSTGEPLSLPESKETLAMQLKQLADGKRSAVFVAEGSPKVLVPRGMNTIPTQEGRIHFNPKFMTADHVRQAVANGRLNDLLGYVQNKTEALDNSLRSGEMPKFVVSRDEDGVEQDAAAVSPDRVHEQAQIFAQRAKPGSKVGIEDSFKTIASREKASRYSPEQKKELEELKSYMTKRASGGPVMHDDTRYALRLANGRQGYADGGAPTMVGAPGPMGVDPTTQFIRNLANAGFSPEQINAMVASQTGQNSGQLPPQTPPPPSPPPFKKGPDLVVPPQQRNDFVSGILGGYDQSYDQATVDNIVGRMNSGDFTAEQFQDWARNQYGEGVRPPRPRSYPMGGTYGPGIDPYMGPLSGLPTGLMMPDDRNNPNTRFYKPTQEEMYGGFPTDANGRPMPSGLPTGLMMPDDRNNPNTRFYKPTQEEMYGGSPIFPPPIDGGAVNLGGQMGGTYGQGNIPFQGQPMPEFLPPGGQMTAPDIFAPLQAGQSPMTSTPNYSDTNPADGLRSQSDFQHDLASQIAQLGFPGFEAPQQNQLNAPSQSNALNIANSAIMGQQPAYGAGLIQGGNGGFGPGKDGSGTMAHGPGGAALGSGLKNGPSMASGGYGGFGSGYKNGPSGNFGGGGFMPGGMGGMGFK